MMEKFLLEIINLKHDSIYNPNSNGADWYTCRLCYASADDIRGVRQTIVHDENCPGSIAEELYYEMDDGE